MDNGNMPSGVVTEEQFDRSFASPSTGLTKREHFAGLAMQGYMSNSLNIDIDDDSITLIVSVVDALLKELGK